MYQDGMIYMETVYQAQDSEETMTDRLSVHHTFPKQENNTFSSRRWERGSPFLLSLEMK